MGTPTPRRGLVLAVLLAGALAIPAPAAARESIAPNLHDFGAGTIGTTSAPFNFTLKVTCQEDVANPGTCLMATPFSPSFSVGAGFLIQSEDCPATLPGDTAFGTTCTIAVSFRPTAAGAHESILETGSAFARGFVRGAGVEPPPPLPPAEPGGKTKKKKCKKAKKRSAAAAKRKCRKKKKK